MLTQIVMRNFRSFKNATIIDLRRTKYEMLAESKVVCRYCGESLSKNINGLNKKLLGCSDEMVMCLTCLADFLDCSEDDLLVKIEEFKEQGCTLFK